LGTHAGLSLSLSKETKVKKPPSRNLAKRKCNVM
jgi:hypothetical protein